MSPKEPQISFTVTVEVEASEGSTVRRYFVRTETADDAKEAARDLAELAFPGQTILRVEAAAGP